MRTRSKLGAVGLGLAAALLAASPIACGGSGGGGGVGLAVGTLGVSAILAGASPGWNVVDPAHVTPTTGAAGVTATVTPENNPLVITAAATDVEDVDRVILCGGQVNSPITFAGSASASSAATLKVTALWSTWDGDNQQLEIATGTATIGTAAAPFAIVLNFATIPSLSGFGTNLTGLTTYPGDQITLRFSATGGDVRIDTTQARVSFLSTQNRMTTLQLIDDNPPTFTGRALREDPRLTHAVATAVTPTGIRDVRSPSFGGSPQTVLTGQGQSTKLAVFVAGQGSLPVPNVQVRFVASPTSPTNMAVPATQTVLTDGEGIATVSMAFPATGSALVTATALNATGAADPNVQFNPVEFPVTVEPSTRRGFDGLTTLPSGGGPAVSSAAGETLVAQVVVHMNPVGDVANRSLRGGGNNEDKVTQPLTVEYHFARDVTSGAQWAYDIGVRTESPLTTATATFSLRIDLVDNGGVVTQTSSPVATAGPFTATASLQRFAGNFTHLRDIVIAGTRPFSPFDATGVPAGFQLSVIVNTASVDGMGVEVSFDEASPSFVKAPGPVVFATTPSRGRGLASQPDPRK